MTHLNLSPRWTLGAAVGVFSITILAQQGTAFAGRICSQAANALYLYHTAENAAVRVTSAIFQCRRQFQPSPTGLRYIDSESRGREITART
jgi:hypothetical protein